MTAIETTDVAGFTVEIHQDTDPMSPREWDNVGTIAGCDDWMFSEMAASDAGEAYRTARSSDGPILALPVHVLDGPYTIVRETSDWSYADGVYFAPLSKIESEGFDGVAGLRECLRAELATLNQYLEGDVYGFVVEDPHGEMVDSCYGFFGTADAMAEGVASAEHAAFAAACDWAGLPEWVQQYVLIREPVS